MSSPSFRLAMAGAGFVAGAALVYAYRIYNKKPSIDVRVVAEKEAMGAAAAAFTAKHVNAAIAKKGYARVIVATGASVVTTAALATAAASAVTVTSEVPAASSSALRLASAAKGPAVSITDAETSTPPPASLFQPDTETGTGMMSGK